MIQKRLLSISAISNPTVNDWRRLHVTGGTRDISKTFRIQTFTVHSALRISSFLLTLLHFEMPLCFNKRPGACLILEVV